VIVGAEADRAHRPGRAAIWYPGFFGDYTKVVVGPGDDSCESMLYDVNLAGYAVNEHGRSYAILYDGATHDLNKLFPVDGVHFLEARGINNWGDIVGTAIVRGNVQAFILTAH